MGRTYESPATERQRQYIWSLLRERDVPRDLIARATKRDLTDGDCRYIIPKLEACGKNRGHRMGSPQVDEEPLGGWEDWRDHPDAIFGHPLEHGSH